MPTKLIASRVFPVPRRLLWTLRHSERNSKSSNGDPIAPDSYWTDPLCNITPRFMTRHKKVLREY